MIHLELIYLTCSAWYLNHYAKTAEENTPPNNVDVNLFRECNSSFRGRIEAVIYWLDIEPTHSGVYIMKPAANILVSVKTLPLQNGLTLCSAWVVVGQTIRGNIQCLLGKLHACPATKSEISS